MQAQKIQALLNFDRRLFSKYNGFEVSESRRTKSLHRKHQILLIRYRLQGDIQIAERTGLLNSYTTFGAQHHQFDACSGGNNQHSMD